MAVFVGNGDVQDDEFGVYTNNVVVLCENNQRANAQDCEQEGNYVGHDQF
jgi:hypothetical protein